MLQTLHEAGFSIWPFCEPGAHTVLEIYPRALTGTGHEVARRRPHRLPPHELPGAGAGDARPSGVHRGCVRCRRLCAADVAASRRARRVSCGRRTLTMLLEGAIWLPATPQAASGCWYEPHLVDGAGGRVSARVHHRDRRDHRRVVHGIDEGIDRRECERRRVHLARRFGRRRERGERSSEDELRGAARARRRRRR